MSYYEYEGYYSEPNEFEQQIDEFKASLYETVKQEHKDRMSQLEKENNELQKTKKNFNTIKSEYETKIRELENEKTKLEQNARRMRLEELFGEEINVILFKPYSNYVYSAKCDKCNDDRQIIFNSPSGKEMKEDCICVKGFNKYKPTPYYCSEFRVNSRRSNGELPLIMWYKKYRDSSDDDGYTYDTSDIVKKIYSDDLSFDDILKEYSYSIYFRKEEDCKRYCDWVNDKNGITDDFTEEKCSNKPQKKGR